MGYTVDYTNAGANAKAQAIADVIAYLGQARYDMLTNAFLDNGRVPLAQFELMASFAGVQGFPARAWYEQLAEQWG